MFFWVNRFYLGECMEWSTPFVVYRLENGVPKEVFHPLDLKKANYWMRYIAHPWDMLCRTPIHPKHTTHHGSPEYMNHKGKNGHAISGHKEWLDYARQQKFEGELPTEQQGMPGEEPGAHI